MQYKYTLKFLPTGLKEWKKLDATIQGQLKKKLAVGKRDKNLVYKKATKRKKG